MPNKSNSENENKRLGLTFHRTFSLVRPAVSQIIIAADEVEKRGGKKLDLKSIKELANLGSIYVEAMPRYARGAGLLDYRNFLTSFGKRVVENDPLLDLLSTQWLMHYYLSVSEGPGADFWHEIVVKWFYPGSVFSVEEVVEYIGNFIWELQNKIPSERSIRSSATIFLGTYIKPEGLGKLGLLEVTNSGRYRVGEPYPPPVWVVGYALLNFWAVQYPGRISIGLDTLQESEFLKLFFMSNAELDEVLQTLQEARYIEVHRTAPPYQIVLLRQDPIPLLENLYGPLSA